MSKSTASVQKVFESLFLIKLNGFYKLTGLFFKNAMLMCFIFCTVSIKIIFCFAIKSIAGRLLVSVAVVITCTALIILVFFLLNCLLHQYEYALQ
jgi:hypothetical protein